jgi:hypothetical protein
MSKKHPIAIRSPEAIITLAQQAPINCETNSEKLVTLINHFLDNQLPTPDMRDFDIKSSTKHFTLRLSTCELTKLDTYCSKTLYTRQQAFQIAICASVLDLGLILKR